MRSRSSLGNDKKPVLLPSYGAGESESEVDEMFSLRNLVRCVLYIGRYARRTAAWRRVALGLSGVLHDERSCCCGRRYRVRFARVCESVV